MSFNPPIVYAGVKRTILLLHEEEPCPSWRGRGTDDACYQRIVNIPLHGLPLRSGQRVKVPLRWGSAWQQVNRTVILVVRRQSAFSFQPQDMASVRNSMELGRHGLVALVKRRQDSCRLNSPSRTFKHLAQLLQKCLERVTAGLLAIPHGCAPFPRLPHQERDGIRHPD